MAVVRIVQTQYLVPSRILDDYMGNEAEQAFARQAYIREVQRQLAQKALREYEEKTRGA